MTLIASRAVVVGREQDMMKYGNTHDGNGGSKKIDTLY